MIRTGLRAPGQSFLVRDVKIEGQPLDLDEISTAAIPDFLLKQDDGYTIFAAQPVRVTPRRATSFRTRSNSS
jgi:hypothetical protein